MPNQKPKVFIGSARESIDIASAVHEGLSYHAEVTPWYAGTFHAMNYTMEDLESRLDVTDFAVFIFSPDDIVERRGETVLAPRDNTVFEMGLFWGKLKRDRVFFIVPESVEAMQNGDIIKKFHLLSDVHGLTVLKYETRSDGNVDAAVSRACRQINLKITRLGLYDDPAEALTEAKVEMARDESLHHFFLYFSKKLMSDPADRYVYLADALRTAYWPNEGFRVSGTAVWKKKDQDGLEQIAGTVGEGKFYPFSINDNKLPEEPEIYVVDAFLKSLVKVALLNDGVLKTYLICYPLGKDLLIVIHVSGRNIMDNKAIEIQLEENEKLIATLNILFGGEVH